MTRLDSIQQIAVRTFAELGTLDPDATVVPTLLIRDQKFVGFRFQCAGDGSAVAGKRKRPCVLRRAWESGESGQDWISTKSSVILDCLVVEVTVRMASPRPAPSTGRGYFL